MQRSTRVGLSEAEPPLRLALFTGNYNHIADGVSRTLNRVVAFLERKQVPVLVFGPTVDDPPVRHEGELVNVPSIPAPGRREYRLSVRFPKEAQRRLEAFAPTLVHVATPDFLGYRALRWANAHDVPVVATYHTHFTSYLQYYGLEWLERSLWAYARWFYGHCDEVYVPSRSMVEVLQSHDVGKVLRIWERGVETERFHPRHRSTSWRQAHGIADDEVVLLFVSRLVWEKGLNVYADVANRLASEGRPVRSLVVGDGPAREELAERLPEDAVFTGHLDGAQLATAFASGDIFLFPSDTETFGNVTLEAMASGLPAVCADATGSDELVRHDETGFLAPPGDLEAFLRHTRALVDEPTLRTVFGEAGRRAAQHYDWEAVLQRLLDYYRGVLGRRAGLVALGDVRSATQH